MEKDSTSVPLTELSIPFPNDEIKGTHPKRKSKKPVNFKMIFLVLICILILLLIACLVIVSLRSYQTPCPYPTTTELPISTDQPRIRIQNQFWNAYFLPTSITPKHYNLTLQLLNTTYNIMNYNLTNSFFGMVYIYLQIHSPTNMIVLHAKYLKIQTIKVKEINEFDKHEVDVKINQIIIDEFYNYLILVLEKKLNVNRNYVVDIKYSGIMSPDKRGIITTAYNDIYTKKQYFLLYSKLEPIGARQVFPCFDEPDKKITFTVKIIHYDKYEALSNMPLLQRYAYNYSQLLFSETYWNQSIPLAISEFKATTIPMSIYLLAFVVMDNYNHTSLARRNDKSVRIWYPNGLVQSAIIPLPYASQVETFFENYFNFTSPLPKTDHIYIPDFLSGAMENWGLITYRDKHLLIPDTQTEYQSKISFMTIAHELAHFWFGNWITTKTWGETWLNEGFATYFASYAYYKNKPLPGTIDQELFLYERRQILNKDIVDQFSIIVNLTDPQTFGQAFSSMSYHKGQAMLVWLESLMGEIGFQRAIQNYIQRYAMKNPTNEQFFDCMDEIGSVKSDLTNIPKLKKFFKPWFYESGFPIVSVNYDLGNESIILTQRSNLVNSSSLNRWPIHTTYKTRAIVNDIPLYFKDKKTVKMPLGVDDYVILNSNGKSYVRVNYSDLLWYRIIDELRNPNSKINQISKIVLLDDAFTFTEDNKINISITKGLIHTYINETNTIPWLIFYYKIFDKLQNLFKDDLLFIRFSNSIIKLSEKIVKRSRTEIDPYDSKLNLIDDITQRAIYTMSCEANNEIILNWVSEKFNSWIKAPTIEKLPKHLVNIILFYGMKMNDKTGHWTKLWKMWVSKNYTGPLSKSQIAVGLVGTAKSSYIIKVLNGYLIKQTHRSIHDKQQDFWNVVDWITKSTKGVLIILRWVVTRSESIKKYAFGDNISTKNQIINFENLLSRICKTVYEHHLVKPLLKLHRNGKVITKYVTLNNHWRQTIGKKLIEVF